MPSKSRPLKGITLVSLILGIIVVGGLAWYLDKTYLEPQATTKPTTAISRSPASVSQLPTERLVYVTSSNPGEIWQWQQNEKKKLFTDADEKDKIIKFSNLAPLSKEVLVITGSPGNLTGKLVAINLEKVEQKVLQKNFTVPSFWAVTGDGGKIAYTRFSNLEENYGYTLYSETREGFNKRELANSPSEIKSPAWNPNSSKVAFVTTSGTRTDLNIVEVDSAKSFPIKSFDDKIIDWIFWQEDGKVVIALRKTSDLSTGEIDAVTLNGDVTKVIDIEGGVANFIFSPSSGVWLGYLVAQYKNKTDEKTPGQIYIFKTSDNEKIPIQKGIQILGWLP